MRAAEIPPLHIGEYGVGRGGLRHPNLWAGDATPRTARSAVLWVMGRHYDIFGWEDATFGVPEAAAAVRAGLRR